MLLVGESRLLGQGLVLALAYVVRHVHLFVSERNGWLKHLRCEYGRVVNTGWLKHLRFEYFVDTG